MKTTITVIVDNIPDKDIKGEWGLSVLVGYGNKKILVDSGASDLFLKNLQKMGIDVSDSELFRCTVNDVKTAVLAVKNRTENIQQRTLDFKMRPEQEAAVEKTAKYFEKLKKKIRSVLRNFSGMLRCASVKHLHPISWQKSLYSNVC